MRKCPRCKKPVEWKDNPHRPFCSERCKLIDLGAWASEEYAVPSEEAPPFEELDRPPDSPPDGSDRTSGS